MSRVRELTLGDVLAEHRRSSPARIAVVDAAFGDGCPGQA